MSEEYALEVNNLFYFFKKHRALNGVKFSVDKKSIHGFVGPNGAGKTTTLKVISTLLKPKQGGVKVFGLDVVKNYQLVRRRIGFMPDHFSMYRQMSVFEYLDFFAAAYGLNLKERDQVIGDVLALTDMDGRKDDLIKGLSRGMQQRVSLARVLVHDPDLLLLDEPASGLDPRARIELMDILKELRNMGKTIFISSHILKELSELCDSVTILDAGKVQYTGSMQGLLTHNVEGERVNYRIKLESTESDDTIIAAVEALEGVESIVFQEGRKEYSVVFEKAICHPNKILEVLMKNGGKVDSFSEDLKHLDQAFMDLTSAGVRSK